MRKFTNRHVLTCSLLLILMLTTLSGCGGTKSTSESDAKDTSPASEEKQASDESTYEWKVALNTSQGDVIYDTVALFAEELESQSNGRIKTELYPGGVLGTGRELLEGLSFGAADIYVESVGTMASFTDMANIDAVPYLYSGYDHFIDVWQSDLGEEMRETIGEEGGFKLLGGMYRGARIVTSTKEIHGLEDVKGFKLRAPGLDMYLKTWQWMDATPTPLAITETYTAIQQHTVEGQENPIIESTNLGFYDVCPYFINTNHVYSQDVFFMDRNKFDGLPEDIQSILIAAAEKASNYRNERMIEAEGIAKEKCIEQGVTFIDVDVQEFIDKFDGFVESDFPYLTDWASRIKAMNQ